MDAPKALTQIVHALVADAELREWFENLGGLSDEERSLELRQMARRMQESGGRDELAHAIALLAAPGIFEGTLDAMREVMASA